MGNPRLCVLLLDHVRSLGFNVGRCTYADARNGMLMVCLDAVENVEGHAFTVRAPIEREYDATVELCRATGIDLMDG